MSSTVKVSRPYEGVFHVVLDDPGRSNPIDLSFVETMTAALRDPAIAVIVVSASGSGAFCGGGDISLGSDGLRNLSSRLYQLYGEIVRSSTVLIVAAEGIAVGAGAQVVLASDLRLVSSDFRFRVADLRSGLVAGMWALSSDVGRCRAMRMLLCAEEVTAADAVTWGLVTEIAEAPISVALDAAARVAGMPERTRSRIKSCVAAASLAEPALHLEAAGFEAPDLIGRFADEA